jgi:hypothetical protein
MQGLTAPDGPLWPRRAPAGRFDYWPYPIARSQLAALHYFRHRTFRLDNRDQDVSARRFPPFEPRREIGWAIAFEMAINAQLIGLKLGEVPIISIDRLFGGKSSFQLIPWVVNYLGYFITAITRLPRTTRPSVKVRLPTGM